MKHILTLIIVFLSSNYIWSENNTFQTQYWNKGRGYKPFSHSTSDGLRLDNQSWMIMDENYRLQAPVEFLNLTFRATNNHANPSKRYPYVGEDGIIKKIKDTWWGFYVYNIAGDTLMIRIGRNETEGPIESVSETTITTRNGKFSQGKGYYYSNGIPDSQSYYASRQKNDNTEGWNNSLTSIEIDSNGATGQWQISSDEGRIILSAGSRSQTNFGEIGYLQPPYSGFGFFAGPAADLKINDIKLLTAIEVDYGFEDEEELNQLLDYLNKSMDPYEGFWMMFDRDLEESYLKPGGDYMVAIISNGTFYKMLYIDGAAVNSRKWHTGMTKGKLYPTHFADIFDAEWIDAEGNPISNGVKAQLGDGETLQIQFPYHSSSLRLRKIPLENLDFSQKTFRKAFPQRREPINH